MKFLGSELRSQILVEVIISDPVTRIRLSTVLEEAGYRIRSSHAKEDSLIHLRDDPPHILIFQPADGVEEMLSWFRTVKSLSDDIHTVALLALRESNKWDSLQSEGCLNDVYWAVSLNYKDILHRLDQTAYELYLEHQILSSQSKQLVVDTNQSKNSNQVVQDLQSYLSDLSSKNDINDVLKDTAQLVYQKLQTPVLCFRYLPAFQAVFGLAAIRCLQPLPGMTGFKIETTRPEEIIFSNQLQDGSKQKEIDDLAQVMFGTDKFKARWLMSEDGDPVGLFLISLTDLDQQHEQNWAQVETIFSILEIKIAQIRQKELLYQNQFYIDPKVGCLSEAEGRKHLEMEIRRASRHSIPLCLVAVQLKVKFQSPLQKTETMKYAVKVLEVVCRHTDHIFRLSDHELGLILPHTDQESAFQLVQRLRNYLSRGQWPMLSASQKEKIQICFGVTERHGHETDIEILLNEVKSSLDLHQDGPWITPHI